VNGFDVLKFRMRHIAKST